MATVSRELIRVEGQRDRLLALVRSYLMTYPLDEYADAAAKLVEEIGKP